MLRHLPTTSLSGIGQATMPTPISVSLARDLMELCEERYKALTVSGCDEDVAADRVFDALICALERQDQHCFDPRDRLFENRLRTTAKKG